MKFKFLVITLFCFTASLKTIAQTEFKEGYIVSNDHKRIDCLIRNTGHDDSTMDYEYKLKIGGEVKEVELSKIEEFGIENEIKCIRAFVAIDVSENTVLHKKDAIIKYEEGHVYLKSLFEGKLASLYTFFYKGNPIYYYSRGDKSIEPLVYKKYYIGPISGAQDIFNDNTYQDQLKENLTCGSTNDAKNVSYTAKDLIKYFTNYHNCKKSDYLQLKTGHAKKGHLLIKPGIILSSTQLNMRQLVLDAAPTIHFEKKHNVSFGLELEYILPFNNYMLSVFTEANYLTYSTEGVHIKDDAYIIDYKFIEFSIGLGYNFYVNKNQRLYLKAAFAPHYILESSYVSLYTNRETDLSPSSNFLLGVGYNYNNLGIEFKYYTPLDLSQNLSQAGSNLQQLSLKLSYSFQLFGDK